VLSVLVEAVFPAPPASCTVFAAIEAVTVPLLVSPITAMLYVVPLPVTVAVPAVTVTSELVKSVTVAVKTAVKLMGPVLVGSGWPAAWLTVTAGLVLLTVTLLLDALVAVQLPRTAMTV
jgi:hypothetical protein